MKHSDETHDQKDTPGRVGLPAVVDKDYTISIQVSNTTAGSGDDFWNSR